MASLPECAPEITKGEMTGVNLLSMRQLDAPTIDHLLAEAAAAEQLLAGESGRQLDLLSDVSMRAVMRQNSTRTAGSMKEAMFRLGGDTQVISGMQASSESKGETIRDSWIAFATQTDIIATRTPKEKQVYTAAEVIAEAHEQGKIRHKTPIINLGNGKDEHVTQAIGDLYTIKSKFGELSGLKVAIVGDHSRYRSHRSLTLGAFTTGMQVMAVESRVAQAPEEYKEMFADGDFLTTRDLDEAMEWADILYMGRQPDEYDGKNKAEKLRARQLTKDYKKWRVDYDRLQIMHPEAIVLHPRPRRKELHKSVDNDPRAYDVIQMEKMIPARMAILAAIAGKSIIERLHLSTVLA